MGPRRESWVASNLISNEIREPERHVKNVEKLLKEDHTIPFIARYRKEMTGDMSIENLYKVKEQLARLDNLSKKIEKAIKDIEKMECLTPGLEEAVRSCSTLVTLEQVTAEYKPGKKKSRAEQAKALGLNDIANAFFTGKSVNFQSLVGSNDSLKSLKSVIQGVKDISAERIRTNKTVLEACEQACAGKDNVIECTESKSKKESDKVNKDKFDQYFNFKRNVGSIKEFQVMAINRGEKQKVLSVKVQISYRSQNLIKNNCHNLLKYARDDKIKQEIVEDACTRLVFPLVCRRVRSNLTESAVGGSVDVFANNLKHLLLTRPITGITILALDPGYTHGCKVAVLNKAGDPIKTEIFYLQGDKKSFRKMDEMKLKMLQREYKFDTVAIGNGTACRETEHVIARLISDRYFTSEVKYTIVDERGASIYSVTKLAQEELPGLETNHRSAVSIGRRLLDPLSEYVKIEPEHLGVGQYQHDIPQKKLNTRLNDIVTECVSFTGLDINRSQQHMLERVAGLTKSRASAIIAWRKANGPFVNRHQIQGVKGIGDKSYEQCVGFLRVYPDSGQSATSHGNAGSEDEDYTPGDKSGKRKRKEPLIRNKRLKIDVCYLDQTSVHPESYILAEKLIKTEGLKLQDIGTKPFTQHILSLHTGTGGLAERLATTEGKITCVLSALSQERDTDYRDHFSKPIFKSTVTSAESVTPGTELEGRVSNVTHFGAFVDVGLGRDGLIHSSKMRGVTLQLGQRVKTVVEKKDHKGIGLRLVAVLE